MIVASQITQQFLIKIEVNNKEDAEAVVEDINLVDYNSVKHWENDGLLFQDFD